ncbi:tetratricopeptide repeat protein [Tropicibacter oceani]|uniref:Tetratricopeptide repeat protein n=1 Tax=Tropicibacter oceani TaxID=3058420 RepID=A0ABY8QLC9_9RHOB|nr:tetratricopeptide repeat protein [Tropicibacter oceani]WGW05422.1 tetratricopeptide repeat protein [Tropicibacter oceani]
MDNRPLTLRISLLGPLRMVGAKGDVLTPKGAKNQALLALLALSPGMSRPRRWIEDKLWSTFGPEQASANLRQALSKLRSALGDHADALRADRTTVSLDRKQIWVDSLDDVLPLDDRVELLQGIDVRDPEFEEWLRMERAALSTRIARAKPTPATGILIHCNALAEDPGRERMMGEILANQIGENISEQIRAWRQDRDLPDGLSNLPPSDVTISTQLVPDDTGHSVFIKAVHQSSGRILYSKLQHVDRLNDILETEVSVGKTVFEAADQIIGKLPQVLEGTRPETRATALSRLGLYRMFSFERSALREAYGLMKQAYDHDNNGVYLAWTALIRTIQIVELAEDDAAGLREEAVELHYKALESGTDNALVQALAAKIKGTALRDGAGFFELAKRAVERNPANAIAWNSLAEAHLFAGQFDQALAASKRASHIASTSPFKHWWDTGRCLIAIACNKPDEAIEAGEAATRSAPLSRPAHRQLLALYALQGDLDKARAVADKLTKIEPGFSLDRLVNDASYPVTTLRKNGMLEPIRALL